MPVTIVDPSRMRQTVTLQSLTTTTSSVGQVVPTWTTVGDYWAEVITTGGEQGVNADQLKATRSHTITMRQVATITPGLNQFIFNGMTLSVTSVVAIDNRNAYYLITCRELVNPQ